MRKKKEKLISENMLEEEKFDLAIALYRDVCVTINCHIMSLDFLMGCFKRVKERDVKQEERIFQDRCKLQEKIAEVGIFYQSLFDIGSENPRSHSAADIQAEDMQYAISRIASFVEIENILAIEKELQEYRALLKNYILESKHEN